MGSAGKVGAAMTGKEFGASLRDRGRELVFVNGAAKPSDAGEGEEIHFTSDPQGSSWVRVPTAMIESAEVAGTTRVGGESCQLVRLSLKMPAHPEVSVLARLLDQHSSGAGVSPLRGDGVLPLRGDGVLPLQLVE